MNKTRIKIYTLVLIAFTLSSEIIAHDLTNNAPSKKTEIMENNDKQQIEQVIREYQKALGTSNAVLATSLFTKNGKFMPSGGPSAVGSDNIKGSFDYVFSLIKPSIVFTIDEIVIKGEYAFVTSTSTGTSLIHATGQNVPEINRELFVFEKVNGVWKIAQYMFNKMSAQ